MSLSLILALVGSVAQATTTASLQPSSVSVGAPATLRIVTDSGSLPEVEVPGAIVQPTGRSSQISSFNGAVTQQTILTYRIYPDAQGILTVGPFAVGSDTTSPLTLDVGPRAAAGVGPSSPAPFASLPGEARKAFLRIWVGDASPYVGQGVPMTVNAYLRKDVGGTLESNPQVQTSDFVLEGLDEEPVRSEVDVKGQAYTRFTWTTKLTPVRTGAFDLSATLPATLQWVEHTRRAGGSLFDEIARDPLFRGSRLAQMLGTSSIEPQVRSSQVLLEASPQSIEVAAAPLQGRPADFNGAVGDFELSAARLPTSGTVGEPIELGWSVTGTGNLSSLVMPGLADGEGYSAYPPEVSFEPSVRSGTKGTLTFSQLIVPRTDGELALPDLTLSYLDPESDAYRTAMVALPPVQVAPAAPSVRTDAPGEDLPAHPVASSSDVVRTSLLPWTADRRVIALLPLTWIAVLLAWLGRFRLAGASTRLRDRLSAWRRRRGLRKEMRHGVQDEDAERMFRAGCKLIESHGLSPEDPRARTFIEAAERHLYGREHLTSGSLDELYNALVFDLNHKEAA